MNLICSWNTYEGDGGPATCSANQGVCEEVNGPGGDAFACKNSGSTIGTNSCRGYRSCADSDELTSVGNQSCIGKHACWKLNSVGCAGNPNLPSCKSGTVGNASCLGKESCNGASAIVGDHSCHGFQSCISVTENAVIGATSCIGRESCRNLNARIGARSCLTPEMTDDVAYNFETDVPQSVCEDNSGQISGSSCWWPKSCQNNQGRVCQESCRGNEACQNNSGEKVQSSFSCVAALSYDFLTYFLQVLSEQDHAQVREVAVIIQGMLGLGPVPLPVAVLITQKTFLIIAHLWQQNRLASVVEQSH